MKKSDESFTCKLCQYNSNSFQDFIEHLKNSCQFCKDDPVGRKKKAGRPRLTEDARLYSLPWASHGAIQKEDYVTRNKAGKIPRIPVKPDFLYGNAIKEAIPDDAQQKAKSVKQKRWEKAVVKSRVRNIAMFSKIHLPKLQRETLDQITSLQGTLTDVIHKTNDVLESSVEGIVKYIAIKGTDQVFKIKDTEAEKVHVHSEVMENVLSKEQVHSEVQPAGKKKVHINSNVTDKTPDKIHAHSNIKDTDELEKVYMYFEGQDSDVNTEIGTLLVGVNIFYPKKFQGQHEVKNSELENQTVCSTARENVPVKVQMYPDNKDFLPENLRSSGEINNNSEERDVIRNETINNGQKKVHTHSEVKDIALEKVQVHSEMLDDSLDDDMISMNYSDTDEDMYVSEEDIIDMNIRKTRTPPQILEPANRNEEGKSSQSNKTTDNCRSEQAPTNGKINGGFVQNDSEKSELQPSDLKNIMPNAKIISITKVSPKNQSTHEVPVVSQDPSVSGTENTVTVLIEQKDDPSAERILKVVLDKSQLPSIGDNSVGDHHKNCLQANSVILDLQLIEQTSCNDNEFRNKTTVRYTSYTPQNLSISKTSEILHGDKQDCNSIGESLVQQPLHYSDCDVTINVISAGDETNHNDAASRHINNNIIHCDVIPYDDTVHVNPVVIETNSLSKDVTNENNSITKNEQSNQLFDALDDHVTGLIDDLVKNKDSTVFPDLANKYDSLLSDVSTPKSNRLLDFMAKDGGTLLSTPRTNRLPDLLAKPDSPQREFSTPRPDFSEKHGSFVHPNLSTPHSCRLSEFKGQSPGGLSDILNQIVSCFPDGVKENSDIADLSTSCLLVEEDSQHEVIKYDATPLNLTNYPARFLKVDSGKNQSFNTQNNSANTKTNLFGSAHRCHNAGSNFIDPDGRHYQFSQIPQRYHPFKGFNAMKVQNPGHNNQKRYAATNISTLKEISSNRWLSSVPRKKSRFVQNGLRKRPNLHPTATFYCSLCTDLTFYTAAQLKEHTSTAHPDAHHTAIETRLLRKHDEYHPCSTCQRSFTKAQDLQTHYKQEHERVPVRKSIFMCDDCQIVYKSHEALKKHVKRVHEKIEKLYCPHCPYNTKMRSDLSSHLANMHRRLYHCAEPGCDFSTNTGKEYENHKQCHKNIYLCAYTTCYFRTSNEEDLQEHLEHVHNVNAKHCCPVCMKFFNNKSTLTRHIGSHTGEMLYSCHECGEEFYCHTSYYRHRQHTGHDMYRSGITSVPQNIRVQYEPRVCNSSPRQQNTALFKVCNAEKDKLRRYLEACGSLCFHTAFLTSLIVRDRRIERECQFTFKEQNKYEQLVMNTAPAHTETILSLPCVTENSQNAANQFVESAQFENL